MSSPILGRRRREAASQASLAPARSREDLRGQALVEFAIVFPVLFFVIAGIIQFGLIFWSQNTLTQVARDTGRWAATQITPCTFADSGSNVATTANNIAAASSLFGYSSSSPWTGASADSSSQNEVVVSWTNSTNCPPVDNQTVSFVTVQIDHQVPIFFPLVPGGGNLSTSAEFRMEPEPE